MYLSNSLRLFIRKIAFLYLFDVEFCLFSKLLRATIMLVDSEMPWRHFIHTASNLCSNWRTLGCLSIGCTRSCDGTCPSTIASRCRRISRAFKTGFWTIQLEFNGLKYNWHTSISNSVTMPFALCLLWSFTDFRRPFIGKTGADFEATRDRRL